MVTKTPGVGSVYLGIDKDGDGNWLDGANTYRARPAQPAHDPVLVEDALRRIHPRPDREHGIHPASTNE